MIKQGRICMRKKVCQRFSLMQWTPEALLMWVGVGILDTLTALCCWGNTGCWRRGNRIKNEKVPTLGCILSYSSFVWIASPLDWPLDMVLALWIGKLAPLTHPQPWRSTRWLSLLSDRIKEKLSILASQPIVWGSSGIALSVRLCLLSLIGNIWEANWPTFGSRKQSDRLLEHLSLLALGQ